MESEYKYPSKKIIKVWRFKYYILIPTLIISYIILQLLFYKDAFLATTIIYTPLLLINILSFIYIPPLGYKRRKYLFANDRIEVIRGIIFKTTTIIPISRIQHITVTEGPLLRHYSLASVIVFTSSSSLIIDGLEAEIAREIASNFKNKVNLKTRKEEYHD